MEKDKAMEPDKERDRSPEDSRRIRKADDSDEDRRRKRRRKEEDNSDDSHSRDRRTSKRKHKKSSSKSRKKKSSSRKKRRRRDSSDSDSDSYDSDSSSSSDSYSSSSEEDRKKSKKRKSKRSSSRKSKKEKKRKRDKDKKKSKDKAAKSELALPQFGKYGLLKATDFHTKQRSFEVWMAEVKGLPEFKGAKWEVQNYFDEFREDFNTATMPHVKYYDFEKWEMEEYEKQKSKVRELAESGSTRQADEAKHQLEQRKMAQRKQKTDQHLLFSMMSKEKIQEMKRQQQLKAELEVAFKTGDSEKIKKLKAKLEPEAR